MRIEILSNLECMHKVLPAWQDLFENATLQRPTSTPEYCLTWFKHFGSGSKSQWETKTAKKHADSVNLLYLLWEGNQLNAALPLILNRRKRFGVRFNNLTGLENQHNPGDSSLLIRQGKELMSQRIFKAALDDHRWDKASIGYLPPEEACLREFIQANQLLGNWAANIDSIDTSVLFYEGTFQEFLAQDKSRQKLVTHSRSYLERKYGEISVDCFSDNASPDAGFDLFVEVDAKSWKASAPGGEALAQHPKIESYYRELFERYHHNHRSKIWILRINNRPAAVRLCCEVGGMIYGFKTSFSTEFRQTSASRPGFVLDSFILERSWHRSIGFDFVHPKYADIWKIPSGKLVKHEFINNNPRSQALAICDKGVKRLLKRLKPSKPPKP